MFSQKEKKSEVFVKIEGGKTEVIHFHRIETYAHIRMHIDTQVNMNRNVYRPMKKYNNDNSKYYRIVNGNPENRKISR